MGKPMTPNEPLKEAAKAYLIIGRFSFYWAVSFSSLGSGDKEIIFSDVGDIVEQLKSL